MKKVIALIFAAFALTANAAENVKVTVHADQAGAKINREIYGQFSEHLGSCIYGGLWVGENSQIPNINGYRKDVFEALKALKIPVPFLLLQKTVSDPQNSRMGQTPYPDCHPFHRLPDPVVCMPVTDGPVPDSCHYLRDWHFQVPQRPQANSLVLSDGFGDRCPVLSVIR